jgi:hypothetical protein
MLDMLYSFGSVVPASGRGTLLDASTRKDARREQYVLADAPAADGAQAGSCGEAALAGPDPPGLPPRLSLLRTADG